MKKCAISLLLALVMALGLLPVTARASDFDSRLQYEIFEDHVEITGFSGYAAKIVIPDQIENLPVTVICDKAFLFHKLTSIELPDSITYIGRSAFNNCYSLIRIDIPEGVTHIGKGAFNNCYDLTGIHVDSNNSMYSSDDRGVLFDKEKSQLIQAPGAITGSYTIPNSVTSIGDHAFNYCSKLTSIDIPDSVVYIDNGAFSNCSGLTNISIPDGVTHIGTGAFSSCSKLSGIHVDTNNAMYSSDDRGVLFNKEKTRLIKAPGAIAGSYTIPDSVTSVDENAFPTCHRLTSISIPDGVTSIGKDTFSNCTGLTSVDLPNTLISIGNRAFYHCPKLTSIDIPDSVTSIDYQAFSDCYILPSIDLPDGITSIASHTFASCSKLTSISIPDGVTSIGAGAFSNCSSLTSIDFPVSVTSIDYQAFSNCTSLTSICFRGDAPSFAEYRVFYGVTATAYYPADNPTWTEDVMQNYGGKITWVPYTPSSFTDVPPGSFFTDPVAWAEENSITTGASEDSFNPGGECLRAQVVTFLHRAVENPEPVSTEISFTDVKTTDFFYKPVLWAVENGITNGVSADKFGSYDVCNRAAVVTFLWRSAGCPEPDSTDNPFVDVKPSDFFYEAVLWAVENGITNGLTSTEFGPNSPCNRAQVVTFLYRAYN